MLNSHGKWEESSRVSVLLAECPSKDLENIWAVSYKRKGPGEMRIVGVELAFDCGCGSKAMSCQICWEGAANRWRASGMKLPSQHKGPEWYQAEAVFPCAWVTLGGSWAAHIPFLPALGEFSLLSWNLEVGWVHESIPVFFRFKSSLGICSTNISCRLFSDKDPARGWWCRSLQTQWCYPRPCPSLCKCFSHLFHGDFWTAPVLRLKWER